MAVIPVSRLARLIAETTLAAVNAKVLLNQATAEGGGSLPVTTQKFTLTLSGVVVDDLGGDGLGEIQRIQRSITPETITVSRVSDPEEVSITETEPEVTETIDRAKDSDLADNVSESAAAEDSTQNSTDNSSDRATDSQSSESTQTHGREVLTTNETDA
jgi:hypothetical protein